jgi:hypothetical protein
VFIEIPYDDFIAMGDPVNRTMHESFWLRMEEMPKAEYLQSGGVLFHLINWKKEQSPRSYSMKEDETAIFAL